MFARNMFPDNIKNEQDLRELLRRQRIEISDKTSELSFSQSEVGLIEKDWRIIQQELLPRIKIRLCADPLRNE